MSYACDLDATGYCNVQFECLMSHWHSCFGENILTVDYDELDRVSDAVVY